MTGVAVIDASTLGNVLLDAAVHPDAVELLRSEDCAVFIPHLCDVEVASGLRSMIARGVMDESSAQEALEQYRDLSLERVGHEVLLDRVLSLRNNFTAYDSTYVALAEVLGAPLHTADQRLARAVREHTDVDVVEV
mgnify:FL=1